MIKLKLDSDGKHINLRDFYYEIHEEGRGIREKFWIKREKGDFIVEQKRNTEMLFKSNRNLLSCEDWGEIFASKIGKKMGIDVVDYYMAEYDDGESVTSGVLCGRYFVSDKQYEMSGHALQTIYTDMYIDGDKSNKPLNTVYSFLDDLEKIIDFPEEEKKEALRSLKVDLLSQCLFDFLLGQTDRHWLNTTFLVYEKNGQIFIKKAACYDNGCIAFLKRKFSAIQGISKEVDKDPINSPIFNLMMDKYIPMFGVKSSTVNLAPSQNGEMGVKLKVDLSMKDKFIDELTDEILYNPDIAVIFVKFKNSYDINKIVDEIKKEGDNPPPEVIKMIDDVITYQLNCLESVLKKKLSLLKEDKER